MSDRLEGCTSERELMGRARGASGLEFGVVVGVVAVVAVAATATVGGKVKEISYV